MPVTAVTDLPVVELFSSIQGEGSLVGCRQVFLRLAGCNLDCAYCDTDFQPSKCARIETQPGSEQFLYWENPLESTRLLAHLSTWKHQQPHLHHSLSLTGGEPLLHAEALKAWLPQLSTLFPIQLETNGTLPQALQLVIDQVEWVVMDIKLESQTGEPTPWAQHGEFLRVAVKRSCCVKLVVGPGTSESELVQAAQLVRDNAPDSEVFLQPCTVAGQCSLNGRILLQWQALIAEQGVRVRVVPQTHCFLAVL
ncbi:7-carboxy-7-deazaguanine synthase QueE [Desulfuromonas acetoxidans]|uniref:7-carboxy-7-deazaguanine synthase QueE n=1 Tax=Desulfuromonas acetoxidans TaxID=891 RepID=UPI00292CDC68|nr:7-carboxy-7-deazaguanine synthase QueE [Desulfuromonas acetoxidans]